MTETKTRKTKHRNNNFSKRCDCGHRNWTKCDHSRWFNFYRKGTAYRISLDKHTDRHVATKGEAEDVAAEIRSAIKNGTFGQVTPRSEMTLAQLCDVYLEQYVNVKHADTAQAFRWGLGAVCSTVVARPAGGGEAPFGEWRLTDIVTDTVERFREARRAKGTGAVGTNRHGGMLRAMWHWALQMGYVETSPFVRHGQPVVKLADEPSRSRRLLPQEEGSLLAACGEHLRACVEAALETGA